MKRAKWIACILTVPVLLSVSAPADAVGVGGWAGQATNPFGNLSVWDDDCIQEDFGAAAFTSSGCSSSNNPVTWEVQLPVNQGTYTPVVGVAWPIGEPMGDYISCSTISTTARV
jgi:hypothetical protein